MWRSRPSLTEPIGLIAGQGEFPLILAKSALAMKNPATVFGIKGVTDKRIEDLAKETHYLGLGDLGTLIELLKQKNIKQIVLGGGIPKKQIYEPAMKMDTAARDFMSHTQNKGDDHILRALEVVLRVKCGVRILDSRFCLKDLLATKGVMTGRKPTEQEWRDLKLGFKVAKHIGKMDIGQAVVIKDGVVLAVEALEGTNQAIRRGGELGCGKVVVVKASKPNQDLRFDLPCVGLDTLDTLRSVSTVVLGLEAGKTLMISKDKLIAEADRQGLAIVGF